MSALDGVLQNVEFVVDADGRTTAAVLDIESRARVLDWLEDAEDTRLARERLAKWKSHEGWTRMEGMKAEG